MKTVVVEHDAVFVVDDLGLVAELDGLAETALADRTSIGIVQRDEAGRPIRNLTGQALTSLAGDAGHPLGGDLEVAGNELESSWCSCAELAQLAPCIDRHLARLTNGLGGDAGHAGVDRHDLVFCLVGASAQVGADRAGVTTDQLGAVPGRDTRSEAAGLQAFDRFRHLGHPLGEES